MTVIFLKIAMLLEVFKNHYNNNIRSVRKIHILKLFTFLRLYLITVFYSAQCFMKYCILVIINTILEKDNSLV